MRICLSILLCLFAFSVSSDAQPIAVHEHPQLTQYDSPVDWLTVDQQAWWRHPPSPADIGTLNNVQHVHMACKTPVYGVIDAPVEFDCTVVMFHFDGHIRKIDARGDPGSPFTLVRAGSVVNPSGINNFNNQVPLEDRTGDPHGLVSLELTYVMDPSHFKNGGAQVAMFKPWGRFTDHNGIARDITPTLRLPFYVVNGQAEEPAGSGWAISVNAYMTGQPPTSGREPFDYSIVKQITPPPLLSLSAPYTISAIWNPHPKAIDSPAPFEASVRYDPGFHTGNEGAVQWSVYGDSGLSHSHTLDPATLTPGPHKFMMRSMIERATGELQASVTVFNFVVDGGVPPPPPSPQFTVMLNTAGTGSGSVSATPSGLVYDEGTTVTLTATPQSGSSFDGWSGDLDCEDSSLVMTADRVCVATFTLLPPVYDVTVDGVVVADDVDRADAVSAVDGAIDGASVIVIEQQ